MEGSCETGKQPHYHRRHRSNGVFHATFFGTVHHVHHTLHDDVLGSMVSWSKNLGLTEHEQFLSNLERMRKEHAYAAIVELCEKHAKSLEKEHGAESAEMAHLLLERDAAMLAVWRKNTHKEIHWDAINDLHRLSQLFAKLGNNHRCGLCLEMMAKHLHLRDEVEKSLQLSRQACQLLRPGSPALGSAICLWLSGLFHVSRPSDSAERIRDLRAISALFDEQKSYADWPVARSQIDFYLANELLHICQFSKARVLLERACVDLEAEELQATAQEFLARCSEAEETGEYDGSRSKYRMCSTCGHIGNDLSQTCDCGMHWYCSEEEKLAHWKESHSSECKFRELIKQSGGI